MKHNLTNSKIAMLMLILISTGIFFGCDGSSDIIDPPSVDNYAINGVLVQDMNDEFNRIDKNFISARLDRNDSNLTSAQLSLGSIGLTYDTVSFSNDSAYTFSLSPRDFMFAGTYFLSILDGDYEDSVSTILVDNFNISSYNPDSTTVYNNSNGIVLQWTSSANIEGYIVAAVLASEAYSGAGYSAYVTSQTTQDNIPHDAFLDEFSNLAVGDYYLYVYAYTGAPDSALSHNLLPVPLPSQLADNIVSTNLNGNIGSVVVCKRVPIEVAAQ